MPEVTKLAAALALSAVLVLPARGLPAQQAPMADRFTVIDTMIPTGMGSGLHTKIWSPDHKPSRCRS